MNIGVFRFPRRSGAVSLCAGRAAKALILLSASGLILSLALSAGGVFQGMLLETAFADTADTIVIGNHTLTDVSDSTQSTFFGLRLDRKTNRYNGFYHVSNTGATALETPLILVFDRFSDASISLANPDGTLADGRTYKDLSASVGGDTLAAGATTTDVVLQFLNPRRLPISFESRVFAPAVQGNLSPVAHAGESKSYLLIPGETEKVVTLDGSGSVDDDGEIVSYVWEGTPDPENVVSPSLRLGAGTYAFTLTVTDNEGATSAPATVTITVAQKVLYPPSVQVPSLEFTVAEGNTLSFSVSGDDPEAEPVVLSALPALPNAAFTAETGSPASGTFTFHPDHDQQGIHVVAFKARDPWGLTDTKTVRISVTHVNRPPVISVPQSLSVAEGGLLTIPIQASDPDGDPLTLTTDPLPSNAVLIPSASSVTFTPDFTQAGDYDIVCRANDGELTVQSGVRVSVTDVPTGGAGQARELILEVDPVQSPTFLGSTRIRGRVNPTGTEPAPARITSALITSMTPATAKQGQSLEVELVSDTSQPYTTNFLQGVSQVSFGDGITVSGITILNPTRARVGLNIAHDAGIGSRTVRVVTGTETAIGVVGFLVTRGEAEITGVLIDQGTGAPIADAQVSVQGTPLTVTTDAHGNFRIADVPAGSYNLIINAANHELIYREVRAVTGMIADIGEIRSPATVYAPGTAPAQSIFSVLARGIGDTVGHTNRETVKQAIRDTLLMIGGNEAGLLDAYGNQLNPDARDGTGYYSLTDEGVRILADQMMRGDSISLGELLFAIEISFQRTDSPMASMDEWINGLQAAVNAAWADPMHPDSMYALVMFGKGRTLQPEPPGLTAHTRLTSLQAHIFMTSFLTYLFTRDDPTWGSPSRFWRINDYVGRVSHLGRILDTAAMSYTSFIVGVCTMPTYTRLAMAGRLAIDLMGAFGVFELDAYIPVEPVIRSIATEPAANGWEKVVVTYNRSSSDRGLGRFIYSLWRFDSANDTRTLVATTLFSDLTLAASRIAVIEDPSPPGGTYFYAMTVSRLFSAVDSIPLERLETAIPFWQSYEHDMPDPMNLVRTTHQLVSNYSNPAPITVGDPATRTAIAELEVDQEGTVYYLTGEKRVIHKITDEGTGTCTPFIDTSFAPPGAEGLAIDTDGHLYTENAASDMRFGGRIFKIFTPSAERVFTGTLNYYSRLIDFAQPTDAGPMAMAPDNSLLVVDRLSREVKQVDVNATYDPDRRVGQRYARIPDEAVGHAFDMEVDPDGNVYLLYMGLSAPPSAGITFGPTQYLDVPEDYNDHKNSYIPERLDGLVTEYGTTRVTVNVLVIDGQSRPTPNVEVRFESDDGTFLTSTVNTDSDGFATSIIEVLFEDHTDPHAEVEIRAVVPALNLTYTRSIPVTNNLQNLLDEFRITIPRGPLMENNTYYTSGQAAEIIGRLLGAAPTTSAAVGTLAKFGTFLTSSIIGPGVFNNVASVVAEEPDNFVCQAYQRKVLEFLNTTREERPYLLNGLDYGPTMALTIMHKNVVIWDSRSPDGYRSGLFLDPWISQAPEIYDYDTVRMQWLNLPLVSAPRPDFDGYPGVYPLTNGMYYPSIEIPPAKAPPKPVTGVVVAADGPASIEIIDSQGNRTGFDETSSFHGEKDGMWFFKPTDGFTMITLPDPLPYDLRIRAGASGLATVALLFENGQEIRYPEFTIQAGSTSTLVVDPSDRGQPIMTGDGPIPPSTEDYQPAITGISPSSAKRGETLTVTLTGSHTHFDSGESQAMAAEGIAVSSLAVTGPTTAQATLTIGSDIMPGSYIVTVRTHTEYAVPLVSLEVTEDD